MLELPPVEVKENDLCVKMLAAPINPSDINRIEGLFLFLFSGFSLSFLFIICLVAQKMEVNLLLLTCAPICCFIFRSNFSVYPEHAHMKLTLITIRKFVFYDTS